MVAGNDLSERELDLAMASMDSDGSGGVDIEEFSDWYEAMKAKGQMPPWCGRCLSPPTQCLRVLSRHASARRPLLLSDASACGVAFRFGGLAQKQAQLKRDRETKKAGRKSVAAEAAQNQGAVMSMRGR